MVGTISSYDREGERRHTISPAATPEYGEATSLGRLEAEVSHVKAKSPGVRYVGIAGGAKGDRDFLGRHTDAQVVDFWHAAEYLGQAAAVLYRGRPATRRSWVAGSRHTLEHESGGVATVLKRLKSLARARPWAKDDEDVQRAIPYFGNQSGSGRMGYAGV